MSSCTTASSGDAARPTSYKVIGIILAVSSGLFIGVSFVIKKIGLLKANAKYHEEAGEGYGYLKNAWWWLGMSLMIIGEICNFVAYMFTDAILITPLGALSVVITTVLSAIFLKERLSFVGKIGCFLCVLGSITIPLNAPAQSAVSTIQEMQCFVIAPGFLTYAGILIVGCIVIAFWAGPKYGKKSMLVYLSVCSLMGGLSVVATQGLGAAILSQINGSDRTQFQHWFLYVLMVFVVGTLVTEIIFLNKALNLFNTAMVTPTYYVYFTSTTIVTSAILFRGFSGTAESITTIVLGFLTICSGVVLLQFSKSAKDVPDAEVLKGDLDQVRAVANQEDHESEPMADSIRGTAALIRTMSKSRRRREQDEARKLRADSLAPIAEDELVEWDGLRRRKTVLKPGETREEVLARPKTFTALPPQRFASLRSTSTDGEPADRHPHGGLSGLRNKAATVLNPHSLSLRKNRDVSDPRLFPEAAANAELNAGIHAQPPQYMSQTRLSSNQSGFTELPDVDEADVAQQHVLGLPPDLQSDTSYRSPTIRFAEAGPVGHDGAPTPPPHSGSAAAKRTFSFQNVLHRRQRSDSDELAEPQVATPRSGGSLFGFRGRSGAAGASVTEEERLGLVVGDRDRHGGLSRRDGHDSSSDDDDDVDDSGSSEFENIGLKDYGGGGGGGGKRDPGGGGSGGGRLAGRQSLV